MRRTPPAAALALACAALAGCAQSSGVLPVGPDAYAISVHAAPMRGGVPGARRIALTAAGEHCASQGRAVEVGAMSAGPSAHLPGGTVDVLFRCPPRP